MPRPRSDNPAPAPVMSSAPQNAGQPASVPNRARMATYDTGEAPPPPALDFAARMGNVVETSNPLTGETTAISTHTEVTPTVGLDAPPPPPAPTQEQPATPAPIDAIPEKYRNKSPEELIQMHREAEKAMHSRDEEIRIAREYQNRFLQGQLPQQQSPLPAPPPPPTLPSDDVQMLEMMLSKPTQFKQAIVADLMNTIGQSQTQAEVVRKFEANRPVIQSPEFGKFLQTVPKAICQEADRNPQVLDYLLDSFKHVAAPPMSPVDSADKVRANAARANDARTVPSGVSGASQPTFTRLQLMEMQIKDPDRYASLQPEILRLYAQNLI